MTRVSTTEDSNYDNLRCNDFPFPGWSETNQGLGIGGTHPYSCSSCGRGLITPYAPDVTCFNCSQCDRISFTCAYCFDHADVYMMCDIVKRQRLCSGECFEIWLITI